MGSLYTRPNSPYIWIKYYQNGRAVRESTGTTKETVARRVLRTREGDVERGVPINPKMGRITFEDAADDLLNDYKNNGRKTTYGEDSFEPEQFESIRAHLPTALRPVVTFAYLTGWRLTSEVLPLEWRQVDWTGRVVRLDPGTTKNAEGRTFPFST